MKIINNNIFDNESSNHSDYNDHIKIGILKYICLRKNNRRIKLFDVAQRFYRRKMDIVHVFNLITISEGALLSNRNYQNLFSLYEEIESSN